MKTLKDSDRQLIYPSYRMKRKENDQRPQRITKPQRSASKPKAVARVDATAILNVGTKICWGRRNEGGGIDPFEGRGDHDRGIVWYLYSHRNFFQNKNYFGHNNVKTLLKSSYNEYCAQIGTIPYYKYLFTFPYICSINLNTQ